MVNDNDLQIAITADASLADAGFAKVDADIQHTADLMQGQFSASAQAAAAGITSINAAAEKFGTEGAAHIEEAFSKMEARHAVMLTTEEMFGIRMPRAIASFVASIEGLGPILEAAFPLLAAFGLLEVITKIIEKLTEIPEELKKATEEIVKMNSELQKLADETTHLKEEYELIGLTGFQRTAVELQQASEKTLTLKQHLAELQGAASYMRMFEPEKLRETGGEYQKIGNEIVKVSAELQKQQAIVDNLAKKGGIEDAAEKEAAADQALSAAWHEMEEEARVWWERVRTAHELAAKAAEKAKKALHDEEEAQNALERGYQAVLKVIAEKEKKAAETDMQVLQRTQQQTTTDMQAAAIAENTDFRRQDTRLKLAHATAEQIETLEEQHEDRLYKIRIDALEKEQAALTNYLAMHPGNPQALSQLQKLHDEIEKEEATHVDNLQKIEDTYLQAREKSWQQTEDRIDNMVGQTVASMMNSHQSLLTGVKKIGESILIDFVSMEATKLSRWVLDHTIMEAIHALFHTHLAAQDIAAGAAQDTTTATTNVAAITSDAALAGATAYAFWAWDPALAAAMAAEADASVMSFIPQATFGKGGVVPRDMIAMVHAGEKILPDGGKPEASGMGGANHIDVHFHISGMDGNDVYRTLSDNRDKVIQVIREAARDGEVTL